MMIMMDTITDENINLNRVNENVNENDDSNDRRGRDGVKFHMTLRSTKL